jgi:nicotinamide-nucleotide amidase
MKVHILTIGDEILIGQVINSNAAYIGETLLLNQITLAGSSVVGDNESDILKELKRVHHDNDVVLITGGLGPTHDDLTRKCIVEYFNTKLVVNNEVLNDITKFFEQRGRALTPSNEDQANVPENAQAIRNPRGTAPGFFIEEKKKIVIAMPGVPYEMKGMMESFVIPQLLKRKKSTEEIAIVKNLLTTGIPESMLFERLGNLDELLKDSKMAFLPNQFGVRLRITTKGKDETEARNKFDEIEQTIRSKVGRYIFGKETDTLEGVVALLLTDRGLKISTAESCTGGLIASRLTNISGSTKYFERGVISYSNASKVELLSVNEDIIHKNGAVSMEVAMQMAEGARVTSGSDIGIAVTGIMGPTGATINKPVGLVYISISDETKTYAREFKFGDDRILNKERTSQAALEMLRRHLLKIPYED